MEPTYSLDYYDRIFGGVRGPGYLELVAALADELDDYAASVEGWSHAGASPATLVLLRHSHRPLVLNLTLKDLKDLEERLKMAAETQGPDLAAEVCRFAALARQTARALRARAGSVI